ncbi:hypothetical protein E2C01_064966 [Portunus trituberculatus]|uniref:Transmembrane protein n=1 Tax=Portunus trituberculatus TaxID=210409 RepID=A0A5B7HHL2_PORTR|nr:hypothetical protein [Portunus trituberculatus]
MCFYKSVLEVVVVVVAVVIGWRCWERRMLWRVDVVRGDEGGGRGGKRRRRRSVLTLLVSWEVMREGGER